MTAIEFNWNPTDRQLRQFGFIALVALPLAGWMLSGRPTPETWQTFHTPLLGSLAAAGVLSASLARFWPRALKPAFVLLSLITWPIGLVVSEVIILSIYFFLFTPLALLFRIIGRDALDRRIDRSATETYWRAKRQPAGPKSYFRQS